jgi:hypothetical protein
MCVTDEVSGLLLNCFVVRKGIISNGLAWLGLLLSGGGVDHRSHV